jgi:hypothetical protein
VLYFLDLNFYKKSLSLHRERKGVEDGRDSGDCDGGPDGGCHSRFCVVAVGAVMEGSMMKSTISQKRVVDLAKVDALLGLDSTSIMAAIGPEYLAEYQKQLKLAKEAK